MDCGSKNGFLIGGGEHFCVLLEHHCKTGGAAKADNENGGAIGEGTQ